MKFTLIMLSLLLAQVASAQSLREKKIKQEMIERADLIVLKLEDARVDLENEDVASACKKISEVFSIYPAHLKDIGSYMDLTRSRSIKAKDAALYQLISVHKKVNICNNGIDHEYVDPKKMRKDLKTIQSSVEKQRKAIRKSDTGHANSFYYEYEF